MIHAGKGARIGNFIVDLVLITLIVIPTAMVAAQLYPETAEKHSPAFEIIFSAVYFSYYFFFEYFLSRTPGKMLTKTIVVDQEGNKPSAPRLLVRTLLRFFYLEWISFLFGSGIHDLVSRTTVVKIEQAAGLLPDSKAL